MQCSRKNLVTWHFSHASSELNSLTDLLGLMTDEGARALNRMQEEKAWFVKKRLEFTLPEEIAQKQMIYDFANHLEALSTTKSSSELRIKSMKDHFAL